MHLFFKLVFGFLCVAGHCAFSQNYPVFSGFYLNPYLYNPAEAATENAHVFIHHRQQWAGIEGAPVLTAVSYNSLLHETRAGIGVKISSYKRGLLTTNDFLASYAYAIPVSKTNWVYFGLSGGVISNTIDITKVTDPTDPAIANYLSNNLQPIANFGMLFRSAKGLNFSVALPQLFAPAFNSTASFESTAVSPFDNIFVSVYYKRKVEGKIVSKRKGGLRSRVKTKETTAPLELYLNYKYSALGNSQGEVLAKLNVTQNFWVGASYRFPYGFTGNLGFTYDRFLFGYTYEPSSQPEAGFSQQGTHEVALALRIGNPKKLKRAAPVLRSVTTTANKQQHIARFDDQSEDPDNINTKEVTKKKYYVVIRAFTDFNQADAFKKKLTEQKYNANIFYYEKTKKYYVHVLEATKAGDANEEARNLKNYTKLKEAYVLTVETPEK